MKRFTKTLTLTLTALCLSVCFLFAGCAKYTGTYQGATLVGGKIIELKLKAGDKFELSIGDTTKEGTWEAIEETEDGEKSVVIKMTFDNGTASGALEDDKILLGIVSTDLALFAANGATLTKK